MGAPLLRVAGLSVASAVGAEGGTAGQLLAVNAIEDGIEWVDAPSGSTDLSITRSLESATIESSTGTDAVLGLASIDGAGLILHTERLKLAGIETGAEVNVPELPMSATDNYVLTWSDAVSEWVAAAPQGGGENGEGGGVSYPSFTNERG